MRYYRVAPAFNPDLSKVLIARNALSGSDIQESMPLSVEDGDLKFLINAGSAKSDFSIKKNGAYTVSEISALNGGTNFVP